MLIISEDCHEIFNARRPQTLVFQAVTANIPNSGVSQTFVASSTGLQQRRISILITEGVARFAIVGGTVATHRI